jgi:hypothetical protein
MLSGFGCKKPFCAQPKTEDGVRKIKWLHPSRVFAQKVVARISWMPACAGMTRMLKTTIPSHSREACPRADGEREFREQWSFRILPVFLELLPSRQSEQGCSSFLQQPLPKATTRGRTGHGKIGNGAPLNWQSRLIFKPIEMVHDFHKV